MARLGKKKFNLNSHLKKGGQPVGGGFPKKFFPREAPGKRLKNEKAKQ